MTNRFVPALILALLAVAPASAQGIKPTEKPFLWKIEGEKPSFLYGTMHVPDERITTLPPVVTEAIDSVDALYCELDMANAQAEQMAAMGKMMLPQGTSLKDVCGEELFERIKKYLTAKGISCSSNAASTSSSRSCAGTRSVQDTGYRTP